MFPQAVALEQRHGSLVRGMLRSRRERRAPRVRRPALCSFRGGMGGLVARLAAELGDALALASPVLTVERAAPGYVVALGGARPRRVRAREVVLAVPAPAAATLVAPFDGELAVELRQIAAASVASVWIGAPRAQFAHALDGFGCLAPKHGSPLLGVLLCSSVFPHHAPAGHALLRVMSGGVDHPGELERSDGDLQQQALAQAQARFGFSGEPAFLHVERCRNAIAQYAPGHRRRLARIAARLASHPGLALLGASYRQIAVVGQWTREGSHP
jgi:protoporphyrinogen/coproporphyrinogen III oxidase